MRAGHYFRHYPRHREIDTERFLYFLDVEVPLHIFRHRSTAARSLITIDAHYLSLTDPTRRSIRDPIPSALDLVMSPTVCGFLDVQSHESSIRWLLPMHILM